MDLKVVGVEMAPSIGHKTDPEHCDLPPMLKSCKTTHMLLDNDPQSPASPEISVGFSKLGPVICWKKQMYISSDCKCTDK